MTPEEYVAAFIALLAGLGVLLVGFKLLSDNIEILANAGLRKMFKKTSSNRFVGVGIGAGVTAIIQSSGATTVMIVGFVNAGVMTLAQATAMIMGANIGTTITAQIAALGSFDVSTYATLLAIIGIFMFMLIKKEKVKTIGLALSGLGLVFIGLNLMNDAMKIFASEKSIIPGVLGSVTNPILLLLIGAAFTALIQSSSAMTTILISMVAAGISIGSGGNSILYVVLGTNIGTCITALLSGIGASSNAKRAGLIHLMFNFFGSLIFFIILLCWPNFMDVTFATWFKGSPATQIAMFHTFFNLIATLIFLPCINVFVKLSTLIIKDKKKPSAVTYIDDRLLKTPSLALEQAKKETLRLGQLSIDTLSLSIDAFLKFNLDLDEKVKANISQVDILNQSLVQYLIKISAENISDQDEKTISVLHEVMNDFYRETEIADNMMKYTKTAINSQLEFSTHVFEQIDILRNKLKQQFLNITKLFENKDVDVISQVDILESEIDTMRSDMIKAHITRLERNECSPANSGVFINLVSNLERAGDHLDYVAHTIVNI